MGTVIHRAHPGALQGFISARLTTQKVRRTTTSDSEKIVFLDTRIHTTS
jgi:hypothetical protein